MELKKELIISLMDNQVQAKCNYKVIPEQAYKLDQYLEKEGQESKFK
jgi:hypothetical protein